MINPVGNLDPGVWTALASGSPLAVPGSGSETMHHVHADDVAQVVQLAIANRETSVGESFHAVSERALSVRGFDRVLRVSWTVADLAGRTVPSADDVAEALGMRLQRVAA